MKAWIKRSLIGLTVVTLTVGGLAACGHRGGHHGPMSDAQMSEMRGRLVERISGQLSLDATQQQHLNGLADQLMAQKKALAGQAADPRAEWQALIAGPRFDVARAQTLVAEKTEAVRNQSPAVIAAAATFYDSLKPEQQAQVREFLNRSRRGH